LLVSGEKPERRVPSREKADSGFNPTWAAPLQKSEGPNKQARNELDDSELDEIVLQYSEQ